MFYELRRAVLIPVIAVLAVVGCGAEQEAQEEGPTAPKEVVREEAQTIEETTVVIEDETMEQTTSEVVSVGGFSVERPDGGEITVPQVTAEREEVQGYQKQVQPVIEDTVRDISDLVQADARLENGNLSVEVDVTSLEEARASVRDGLQRLREIDSPEALEPIHQRLIEAYEQALPAYDEIIEAAESGDPQRMSAAVSENLPRIEGFNEETRAMLQNLEQAAEGAQP